jgi:hypothetical protein
MPYILVNRSETLHNLAKAIIVEVVKLWVLFYRELLHVSAAAKVCRAVYYYLLPVVRLKLNYFSVYSCYCKLEAVVYVQLLSPIWYKLVLLVCVELNA